MTTTTLPTSSEDVASIPARANAFSRAVAARTRGAVAASGIPRSAIAESLSLSPSALRRRLYGETDWFIDELAALSVLVQCSVLEFFDVEADDDELDGAR